MGTRDPWNSFDNSSQEYYQQGGPQRPPGPPYTQGGPPTPPSTQPGMGQPGSPFPSYAQPGMGPSNPNYPPYAQPGMGQPGSPFPPYAQPGMGPSGPGYPPYTQSNMGQPGPAFSYPNGPQWPSAPHPPSPPVQKARRIKVWHVVLLFALVLLVIAGAILWPNLSASRSVGNKSPLTTTHSVPTSAPTPTLTPHMQNKLLASKYVAGMSLDEELGQLIVAQFLGPSYSTDVDTMVSQQHVGGFILYDPYTNGNIVSLNQTKALTSQMQQNSKTPLILGVDQEGWNVSRWETIYGRDKTVDLSAYAMSHADNTDVAKNQGQLVAQRLLGLGVNVNFAPDVDVSIPDGIIDKDARSFGQTADDVIKYAGAYLQGLQGGGIVACIKHFPGLGEVPADADPHAVLPVVNVDINHINTVDLAPFKYFIQSTDPQQHADMVMPTDVLMPAVDAKYPAEFSHPFITDILRNQLGFDGVVISDSLQMGGVRVNGETLTVAQAAVLAIQAGDDMVLDVTGATQVAEVVTALKTAIQDGTITKALIDAAATRIITLKIERHLMPAPALAK